MIQSKKCIKTIENYEFQYAPNILSYIKMIVDERRLENLKDSNINCNGLFYLTGSQAFQTMSKVDESLAGRVGVLDLYGFSSREIAKQEEENFIPDINILENKKMLEKKILLNYIKK